MAKFAVTVIVCFIFGISKNAYSDQKKLVDDDSSDSSTSTPAGCYRCENCPEVTEDTSVTVCLGGPKCVSYVEKTLGKVKIHKRGCQSGGRTCAQLKATEIPNIHEIDSCSECEGDRCNGAPRSMVDVTTAYITLAILPILGSFMRLE